MMGRFMIGLRVPGWLVPSWLVPGWLVPGWFVPRRRRSWCPPIVIVGVMTIIVIWLFPGIIVLLAIKVIRKINTVVEFIVFHVIPTLSHDIWNNKESDNQSCHWHGTKGNHDAFALYLECRSKGLQYYEEDGRKMFLLCQEFFHVEIALKRVVLYFHFQGCRFDGNPPLVSKNFSIEPCYLGRDIGVCIMWNQC